MACNLCEQTTTTESNHEVRFVAVEPIVFGGVWCIHTHIADPSYDSFVFIYDSLGHTSVLVRRVC